MKISFLSKFIIFSCFGLIFFSCKERTPQFTVAGAINDADSSMLYLEKRSISEVTIIDSVRLNKEGAFKFEKPSLGYSEFYLLRLNGQTVNLAIDSTETITVKASKATFARDYTVEGSESSRKIKEVVLAQGKLSQNISSLKKKYEGKEISQEEYATLVQEAVDVYKNTARDLILSDYGNPAAYFALFQKVEGYLIFDPYDKKDVRMFQAIATVWDQYKSQSPRTAQLKEFTLNALSNMRQMESNEVAMKKLEETASVDNNEYYNITLPDTQNKVRSLSSLQGKVVILDFTLYKSDFSSAHNIQINKVYEKLKNSIEVYQVSFDVDSHAWLNSANNLPWICVRDDKASRSELIAKFNLQGFPTVFLINKKGELVKRILPEDNLLTEVQKIL